MDLHVLVLFTDSGEDLGRRHYFRKAYRPQDGRRIRPGNAAGNQAFDGCLGDKTGQSLQQARESLLCVRKHHTDHRPPFGLWAAAAPRHIYTGAAETNR